MKRPWSFPQVNVLTQRKAYVLINVNGAGMKPAKTPSNIEFLRNTMKVFVFRQENVLNGIFILGGYFQ